VSSGTRSTEAVFVVHLKVVEHFGKEYSMEITSTRSRPTGISIIAVLLFIAAALDLAYGLLAMIKVPVFYTSSAAVIVQVSPWGFLLSGLLAFLVGYGLWTLRGWAFWAVLLNMVIPAVILIYFFADRHVREAFNLG
jgi:hypothetical protein